MVILLSDKEANNDLAGQILLTLSDLQCLIVAIVLNDCKNWPCALFPFLSCFPKTPVFLLFGVGSKHIFIHLRTLSLSLSTANSSLQIVGTVASLCGKMGIGGAFNVMFLYTPEIFPTNIR